MPPPLAPATGRSSVPIYLSRQQVVGVGEVQAGGGDVVELLARARCGLGDVDDLQDLGPAEAGDLHGTHGGEARAAPIWAAFGSVEWGAGDRPESSFLASVETVCGGVV